MAFLRVYAAAIHCLFELIQSRFQRVPAVSIDCLSDDNIACFKANLGN